MKVSQLLGKRFKEAPSDCTIESHSLMTRGGYMKYVSNGIYSLFTPGKRIMNKIEKILREEMEKVGCQEVLFPVVMPASLWEESGRFSSIGSELARWKDRSGNDMVLGMTHEEASVQLVRDTTSSYADYPITIYQIQTKFRDEPRARGGLIRVREFTMKDAYSFHTSKEDLDRFYDIIFHAYERIFRRVGAKGVISVKSDSGMMGGNESHEFMLLTEIGEDTLAICEDCGYSANMEAAQVITKNDPRPVEDIEKVYTPGCKTIDDLVKFLDMTRLSFGKAVVYQRNKDDSYIVVFIRGDLDVNETKLRNFVGCEVHPATITEESGIVAGFIGPVGITENATVIFDDSLKGIGNIVCGANEVDYHFKGINIERDCPGAVYADVAKIYENAICPVCHKNHIIIKKGIEVGNIFKLGTKYSESMGLTYLDSEGNSRIPVMGSYGIGVGRLAASICQESHDDYGPIWPMPIAPWQVEICNLRCDDETVSSTASKLYDDLQEKGVEVLYDDRNIRPGAMFADADLFGVPIRVVVSPKNCEKGVLELTFRDKSYSEEIPIDRGPERIKEIVAEELAKFN